MTKRPEQSSPAQPSPAKQTPALTQKNSAKKRSLAHRAYFANNPVYEHGANHYSTERIRVALSTSSVYPMDVPTCFTYAHRLGYDGVEIMITHNKTTQNARLIRAHMEHTGLPVVSYHAPTLLFLPGVLHRDHWMKLRKTCELAQATGAQTVVVHPPFRWQGDYATSFVTGVRELSQQTGLKIAVENMYPWRAGLRELLVYYPDWNPLDEDYDHLTFDFSHAATAGMNALDTVAKIRNKLAIVHLTDGKGSLKDEHLVPGRGHMPVAETLQHLAKYNWHGDVVVEVNTRLVTRKSTRTAMLKESLEFARTHLGLHLRNT